MGPSDVVASINRAWTSDAPDEVAQLARWFHPDAVITGPDRTRLAEGREACVQSYVDFASNATIHGFEVSGEQVDIIGATAVVSYTYRVVYELAGDQFDDTGSDVMVLTRQPGDGGDRRAPDRWLVVWRMILTI